MDNPLNNPFLRFNWLLFQWVQGLLGKYGVYGYHWVFMAETIALGIAASAIYIAYRLVISLAGKDPDFEYWKYRRRYESQDSSGMVAVPLVYRPVETVLSGVLVLLKPMIGAALTFFVLFKLARLSINIAPNTLFHVDGLEHLYLYFADVILTGLIVIALQCLVVAAIFYVLRKVVYWAARTMSGSVWYSQLIAALGRGRIRRRGRS